MKITFLGNFNVSYSSESHHAATLELLGHTVTRLQEGQVTEYDLWTTVMQNEIFVWVHTHGWYQWGIEKVVQDCKPAGIPTLTYHLDLWLGLDRQRDMLRGPYWMLDHFFTADANMAAHLNQNSRIQGHYLPAGVYEPECYISKEISPLANDVVFVGSRNYHSSWGYRPRLLDWLRETYGTRFTHIGNGSPVCPQLRGKELNDLYASSKVVIGDTLCLGFNYPNYYSDRTPETLGRGGFLIHPSIPGMSADYVGGKHLVYYDFEDFKGLKERIDYYLSNPAERETIRQQGHEHTKANHSYSNRWVSILDEVSHV